MCNDLISWTKKNSKVEFLRLTGNERNCIRVLLYVQTIAQWNRIEYWSRLRCILSLFFFFYNDVRFKWGKNVVSTNAFRFLESLNTCITKQNNKKERKYVGVYHRVIYKSWNVKASRRKRKNIYFKPHDKQVFFLENMKMHYKIKIIDKFYFDFVNMKWTFCLSQVPIKNMRSHK